MMKTFFKFFFDTHTQTMLIYKTSDYFYKKGLLRLSKLISKCNLTLNGIDIEPGAFIHKGAVFSHTIGTVIGGTAVIENGVIIRQNITLGRKDRNQKPGKVHPTIRKDVELGAGTVILGNIEIGENTIIGANSLVLDSIPRNSIAFGTPAKVIKKTDSSN